MEALVRIKQTNVGENRDRIAFGLTVTENGQKAFASGHTLSENIPGRVVEGDLFTVKLEATVGAELTDKAGQGIGLLALVPVSVEWATVAKTLPGYSL